MHYRLIIIFLFIQIHLSAQEVLLPIDVNNRKSFAELRLSEIGAFELMRKARPMVAAHFHAGIDILRPDDNYKNNPIFPIGKGMVISKRDDGPFAQLIIEHHIADMIFWTVYEHIAGIRVELKDMVHAEIPIAASIAAMRLSTFVASWASGLS